MTTWTGLPASELRNTARVAVSVLPSPVFISAIEPVVQNHATDQLDVEMALAEVPPRGLAAEGERLREQVVERLPVAGPLSELIRLGADLGVLEQLHLGLDPIDRGHPPLVLLELAPLAQAQGAVYQSLGHCSSGYRPRAGSGPPAGH